MEFGVHVASAANAMASLRFKVTVTGSLELGIRAPFFAMQRDKSLILSTPADLLVNKGTGSAVIAAADSSAILTVMPLDSSDVGVASARGHAVRIERVGDTRHLTAAPVSPLPKVKR
ncbi:MAG: hypothetical protein WBQ26_15815 [Gemmatimonadaceae bacterium]|nr:hypothetical protein [Gemmatimonadaceae bacterium]